MIESITTAIIGFVTFCITAGGALLAAAAFLCVCTWAVATASHRLWKEARQMYRLQELLQGFRDMKARGHVYPPPVEGDK